MTHLAGYIEAVVFAVLFLVFISGEAGWMIVYTLVGAGIFSVLSCLLSKKHFTVRIKPVTGLAECGERLEYEITLEKTGFCFLPHIELCIDDGTAVRAQTSLLFRKEAALCCGFSAKHGGLNPVTLSGAFLSDFLGLVRLRVPLSGSAVFAVAPRRTEYTGPAVLPKTLPSESEELEEGKTALSGGIPGYEHREYMPGDSIRRINYKLSAKRGKLMVRLDENIRAGNTNIYISPDGAPPCGDMAFALAESIVSRGGSVRIIHKGESAVSFSPETLYKIREWLAFRDYAAPETNPDDKSERAAADIVFSGECEMSLRA